MSKRRRGWYWGGLVLGIIIVATGLWLGEYYIVCITSPGGAGPFCTFGSIEANEIVGWGVIIVGAAILVASLVGAVSSRRRTVDA